MKVVYASESRLHEPKFYIVKGRVVDHIENSERASQIIDALKEQAYGLVEPGDYGLQPILKAHTKAYLDFFRTAYDRWQLLGAQGPEVVPNVHPSIDSGFCGYPDNVIGQAGIHILDTSSPIGRDTWTAARRTADAACCAAELALREGGAYCLARPPGHHAGKNHSSGFCYLNNAAIAAERLLESVKRVAILDVDAHHGNGTQEIFYDRNDVLYVSLHANPRQAYPFYTGYADELGEGDGVGCNYNMPLQIGTSEEKYVEALLGGIEKIRMFRPDALVVSLGFDTSKEDPYKLFSMTTSGFRRVAGYIRGLALPTVLIQEGGYLAADLVENLIGFLRTFEE